MQLCKSLQRLDITAPAGDARLCRLGRGGVSSSDVSESSLLTLGELCASNQLYNGC